jgi:hypothetical protein
MANLFLGFPVPRAKIADMISGSAPPTVHHTQHEDGGSDEMDVTGLVGAGGAGGVPLEDLLYQYFFTSIDGLELVSAGTGAGTLFYNYLRLATGTTANSTVRLRDSLEYPNPFARWDRERRLITRAQFNFSTSVTGDVRLHVGDYTPTGDHVGFELLDGVLKGTVANGSTEYTVDLETLLTGPGTAGRLLEFRHFPGDRVDFYVDSALKGTITGASKLPRLGYNDSDLMWVWVSNKTLAQQKTVELSMWKLWQEA